MLKMRRFIAAVMLLIMTIVVASGCGSTNKDGEKDSVSSEQSAVTETKPEETTQGGAEDEKKEELEPITFKAMWMYDWFNIKWGEDPASRKMTELTGVSFDLSAPTGDGNEKANLMLISKDYPEIMWMDRNAVWHNYVSAGALYAIDVLTEQYDCPKLLGEYIPESTVRNLKHPDGHLYGIPNWFSDKGQQSVGGTLNVRIDIYKALGSPEIKTIDDLYNYLVKVKEGNFEFNGQKVYPFSYTGKADIVGMLANLWGNQIREYKYFDEKEQKVKFYLRNPDVLEAVKFLNRLYREKLFDTDIFTYKGEEQLQALAKGKYAVDFGWIWNLWDQVNNPLKAIDPNVYFKAIEPPAGKPGVTPYVDSYSTIGWNVAVITKNCKNPERAIKFFDFYLSPLGQAISFYGIEGETWEWVDGMPKLKEGVFDQLTADWDGYSKRTGVWYITFNQNQKYNPEIQEEKGQRKIDRTIAEKYAFDGTALSILNLDGSSDAGKAWTNVSLSLDEEMMKVILSKTEQECVDAYNRLLKKCEDLGIAKTEEEWTRQYLERLKY
ncbi:MAG TPA: extracellular solute-binding protein [Clostridiaceae bacterium]|nr:extracellular solute-binding protein [Clostridiaceae bacterium]